MLLLGCTSRPHPILGAAVQLQILDEEGDLSIPTGFSPAVQANAEQSRVRETTLRLDDRVKVFLFSSPVCRLAAIRCDLEDSPCFKFYRTDMYLCMHAGS